MLNKRILCASLVALSIGIVSFNFIQNEIKDSLIISDRVFSNTIQDTDDFLYDIDNEPDLIKDSEYLATRLELLLNNQKEYMELGLFRSKLYKENQETLQVILLNYELTLKSFLEGNIDTGNMYLETLKESYNKLNLNVY